MKRRPKTVSFEYLINRVQLLTVQKSTGSGHKIFITLATNHCVIPVQYMTVDNGTFIVLYSMDLHVKNAHPISN